MWASRQRQLELDDPDSALPTSSVWLLDCDLAVSICLLARPYLYTFSALSLCSTPPPACA